MIIAPYKEGTDYDEGLIHWVNLWAEEIEKNNDDALVPIIGMTGSGKSNLGLHICTLYNKDVDIEQIALTRKQFAVAHNNLKKMFERNIPRRILFYDEADLNSRDSLSTWNKDVMRLYSTNRVLGGLHIWCNPTLQYLDKFFVKERVKAVIFVASKEVHRPRTYYLYTKKGLGKMIDEGIELNQGNLKKYASKYAYHAGYFTKYTGHLLDVYLQHKKESASKIDQDFFNKYSGNEDQELFDLRNSAKLIRISHLTLKEELIKRVKEGFYKEEEVKNSAGRYMLNERIIEQLRDFYIQKKEERKQNNFVLNAKMRKKGQIIVRDPFLGDLGSTG